MLELELEKVTLDIQELYVNVPIDGKYCNLLTCNTVHIVLEAVGWTTK